MNMTTMDASPANPLRGRSGSPEAGDGEVLVLGYGNDLRGDDGAGPAVAGAVEALGLRGVRVQVCRQLTPDLAEAVAQAAAVIFVDAAVGPQDSPAVRELSAESVGVTLVHVCRPESVLALSAALYGKSPRAWLVRVPAVCFDLGAGLSPWTSAALPAAVAAVRELVERVDVERRSQACPTL